MFDEKVEGTKKATLAHLNEDIIRQYAIINWIVALLVNEGSRQLSFLISRTDSGPNLINNHHARGLKYIIAMKPDGLRW